MNKRKILVPTDFSQGAETAAAFAADIAKASGSSITFLHVHDDKKLSRQEVENRMGAFCNKSERIHAIDCDVMITGNNIFKAIPEIASDRQYIMVVIATHGVQGLRQKMLGADILKLIRSIPIPVLVVQRNSIAPSGGFKKMVFPVGGHDRFDRQIDAAVMMAGIFDTEIQVYSIKKKGDEWTTKLKKNIQAAEKTFTDKGIRHSRVNEEPTVLSVGYARQTIRYADSSGSDLISIMSVPTREHYYYAQADKQEMLTNEHCIPVICTSDAERD
jgi:nucleotide-binding universal stress UspA family protein